MAGDEVAVRRLRDAVARLGELTRGRELTGRSHEDADAVTGTVATDDAVGLIRFRCCARSMAAARRSW